MSDDIRQRMFIEMQQKAAFDEARNAAYAYADEVVERKVFPSAEAIANLAQFEELRVSAVAGFDSVGERGELVVLLLCPRIEWVIVALRTLHL